MIVKWLDPEFHPVLSHASFCDKSAAVGCSWASLWGVWGETRVWWRPKISDWEAKSAGHLVNVSHLFFCVCFFFAAALTIRWQWLFDRWIRCDSAVCQHHICFCMYMPCNGWMCISTLMDGFYYAVGPSTSAQLSARCLPFEFSICCR